MGCLFMTDGKTIGSLYKKSFSRVFIPVLALAFIVGCSPTIKVEAPDKPIEINLNIKIEQDVRIRMDKDVDDLILDNPDIF